ncbi:ANTAR domain-containing protein [Streptomyces sp. NPDC048489]|uniref:ANTAR domain-containing protein n=1 Tax=Streptomyces sp. NPDC048489 TaxID=3154504 RepID=UPI00341F0B8D
MPYDGHPLPCPTDGGLQESAARLRAENAQLRQAVESHAVVDQAIGVLIARRRCSAAEAWEVLREVSQHTNTKLRRVADLVVGSTQGCPLPDAVRVALEDAFRSRRPDAGASPGHE